MSAQTIAQLKALSLHGMAASFTEVAAQARHIGSGTCNLPRLNPSPLTSAVGERMTSECAIQYQERRVDGPGLARFRASPP